MAPFRTRIRAVRFKAGGEIRVLPSACEQNHSKCLKLLTEAVETYRSLYAGEMAGYLLIVWDRKGQSSLSRQTTSSDPIGSALLPTFAAERVRRAQNDKDAEDTVRHVLGLPDDAS